MITLVVFPTPKHYSRAKKHTPSVTSPSSPIFQTSIEGIHVRCQSSITSPNEFEIVNDKEVKEEKQLCPLSKEEIAREQINKYFQNNNSENETLRVVDAREVQQQLLQMKSKFSDNQKDLSKYFNNSSPTSSDEKLEKCRNKAKVNFDFKTDIVEDDFSSLIDEIDSDTLAYLQLDKIEQENNESGGGETTQFNTNQPISSSSSCCCLKELTIKENIESANNLFNVNKQMFKPLNVAKVEIHKVKVIEREIPFERKSVLQINNNNNNSNDRLNDLRVPNIQDLENTKKNIKKSNSLNTLDSKMDSRLSLLKYEKKKCTVS